MCKKTEQETAPPPQLPAMERFKKSNNYTTIIFQWIFSLHNLFQHKHHNNIIWYLLKILICKIL